MPGKRKASFRSGDINEELGTLLLKAICLVAPVPRPEDVGVDSLATLVRQKRDLLYAEGSFYVQVKSNSDKYISYKGDAISWLINLELPLLVARIDRESASIELIPLQNVSTAVVEDSLNGTSELQVYFSSKRRIITSNPKSVTILESCKPLLKWSLKDLDNPRFKQLAYESLKIFLFNETLNLQTRHFGIIHKLTWQTNEVPSSLGHVLASSGEQYDRKIRLALLHMAPAVYQIANFLAISNSKDDFLIIKSLIPLMSKYEIYIDPSNLISQLSNLIDLSQTKSHIGSS